ncbi:CBS domain protein [Geothermobacter ehrlichii]|uniref:CBS domain protein n=1 Tax=Geothermobacter ehrlichii TaxID=213224 RepID=A0A5D3WH42_9BACT|nr:CBS domain-containing protein [Geothermobacter ehrlichii]TYO95676.1 CBS domain protein [Geothermobacter ehrlichii]
MLTAGEIMTREVYTVAPETSVDDLAKMFVELNKNALPVVDDDGVLVGLVSQNDLIEQDKPLHIPTVISLFDAVIYLEGEKRFREQVERMTARTVEEICRKDPVTCRESTPVAEVAQLMVDHAAHLVPVVDDEGRVVGVVARLDIIRSMNL